MRTASGDTAMFILVLAGVLACPVARCEPRPLASGEPIPVGTADGRGPFSVGGIVTEPLGCAAVYGSAQPDLFVQTGKWSLSPGFFLYRWVATADNGAPVFGERVAVSVPFEATYPLTGTVLQTDDKAVHGVWRVSNDLVHTTFDVGQCAFVEVSRVPVPEGLPRAPRGFAVVPNPDGTVEVLFEIPDGVPERPDPEMSTRDPQYRPYDGALVWRGGFPYVFMYAVTYPDLLGGPGTNPRLVSATEREVRNTYSRIAVADLGPGHHRDIVTGSHYGGIHHYRNTADQGLQLDARQYVVGEDGNAHRHPTIWASPIAYPNPDTGLSDLLAGGEGGLHHYRFTGSFTATGKPIYAAPQPVLEQDALLYTGSLPTTTAVDWDGDGAIDIVSGNSEGRVLFFKNAGSNEAPAFLPAEPIRAAGRPIHIQPGYTEVQGPGEARWGYTCPTVADWNEDGLPDILLSDSTARHTVFLNRGTPTSPDLDAGHPIYFDDLDLHGTWRVQPGVGRLGTRMAYVTLDDDDEFHLYWRVDDYNVEDGGKLTLEDGSSIRANFLYSGGTGRLKMRLADWDLDGVVDLVLGTCRHASVPDPKRGLPQSLGLPGSSVLFMRNTGSNEQPVYAFPQLMAFHGQPIYLDQHACGPAITGFGGPGGPHLIVGYEDGRILFFNRKDLSTVTPQRPEKSAR